jgi:hypothetical protein
LGPHSRGDGKVTDACGVGGGGDDVLGGVAARPVRLASVERREGERSEWASSSVLGGATHKLARALSNSDL